MRLIDLPITLREELLSNCSEKERKSLLYLPPVRAAIRQMSKAAISVRPIRMNRKGLRA